MYKLTTAFLGEAYFLLLFLKVRLFSKTVDNAFGFVYNKNVVLNSDEFLIINDLFLKKHRKLKKFKNRLEKSLNM